MRPGTKHSPLERFDAREPLFDPPRDGWLLGPPRFVELRDVVRLVRVLDGEFFLPGIPGLPADLIRGLVGTRCAGAARRWRRARHLAFQFGNSLRLRGDCQLGLGQLVAAFADFPPGVGQFRRLGIRVITGTVLNLLDFPPGVGQFRRLAAHADREVDAQRTRHGERRRRSADLGGAARRIPSLQSPQHVACVGWRGVSVPASFWPQPAETGRAGRRSTQEQCHDGDEPPRGIRLPDQLAQTPATVPPRESHSQHRFDSRPEFVDRTRPIGVLQQLLASAQGQFTCGQGRHGDKLRWPVSPIPGGISSSNASYSLEEWVDRGANAPPRQATAQRSVPATLTHSQPFTFYF